MTNEPKLAPQAPASNDADQAAKSTTDAKPIVTPVPVDAPPADTKKS
jgi:hypothetical protein